MFEDEYDYGSFDPMDEYDTGMSPDNNEWIEHEWEKDDYLHNEAERKEENEQRKNRKA